MRNQSLDRRRFLTVAAGVGAGCLAIPACSNEDGPGRTSSDDGKASATATQSPPSQGSGNTPQAGASVSASAPAEASVTPAYISYTAVKPDLPATDDGVPPGFYHYPRSPSSFINHPLGSGGDITWMLENGVANALDKNKWWQALNQAVNANLKLSGVTQGYADKFQVTVAGGNFPDVAQVPSVPQLPKVLDKYFTDLTDYLAGENIKEYPGLASLPPATWRVSTLNGRIWGVTQPFPIAGNIVQTRGDILKSVGLGNSPPLSSGADFVDLCKSLTDVKRNKYAFGQDPVRYLLPAFLEMFEAPNGWGEEDGRLISVNETDAMASALEQVTKVWKAGYVHPDVWAAGGNSWKWWTGDGSSAMYTHSYPGWVAYHLMFPQYDMGVAVSPKWEGGGPAPKFLGIGGYGDFVAIAKAKPDRVKEILRIIDFFAAPFGTTEFLLMTYGVSGVDYTLDGTDPVPITATRNNEFQKAWGYCGSQARVPTYVPGNPSLTKTQYDYLTAVLPTGVSDLTWGLYSETALTAGAAAEKALENVQRDIVQGRKSMSQWADAVKTWRKSAGDAERSEYEKALG